MRAVAESKYLAIECTRASANMTDIQSIPALVTDGKHQAPPANGSFDEEKKVEVELDDSTSSLDIDDADAALGLVGTKRTMQFSEEYNRKLRRKLVRVFFVDRCGRSDFVRKDLTIPPLCAAVYFTQFMYVIPSYMRKRTVLIQ